MRCGNKRGPGWPSSPAVQADGLAGDLLSRSLMTGSGMPRATRALGRWRLVKLVDGSSWYCHASMRCRTVSSGDGRLVVQRQPLQLDRVAGAALKGVEHRHLPGIDERNGYSLAAHAAG